MGSCVVEGVQSDATQLNSTLVVVEVSKATQLTTQLNVELSCVELSCVAINGALGSTGMTGYSALPSPPRLMLHVVAVRRSADTHTYTDV